MLRESQTYPLILAPSLPFLILAHTHHATTTASHFAHANSPSGEMRRARGPAGSHNQPEQTPLIDSTHALSSGERVRKSDRGCFGSDLGEDSLPIRPLICSFKVELTVQAENQAGPLGKGPLGSHPIGFQTPSFPVDIPFYGAINSPRRHSHRLLYPRDRI